MICSYFMDEIVHYDSHYDDAAEKEWYTESSCWVDYPVILTGDMSDWLDLQYCIGEDVVALHGIGSWVFVDYGDVWRGVEVISL